MYDFSRIISHGSFGVVYEVRNKLTSEISALKIEYNEGGFKNRSAAVN
jgi:serine/threonine protein kinase